MYNQYNTKRLHIIILYACTRASVNNKKYNETIQSTALHLRKVNCFVCMCKIRCVA